MPSRWVLSALAALAAQPALGNLGKFSLADVDAGAVCMDGSPAAYYYKPTMAPAIISCDQCSSSDKCNCGWCGSFGGCSFTCNKPGSSEKRPPLGQRCAADHGEATRASETWIVYLEGGGWCYDEASCRERCGDAGKPSTGSLCSSKGYKDNIALGGIFYPRGNDDLLNAHKVYVKYCTSDAHMGNGEAFGFQFRGEVVVRAVLRDLAAKQGLGSGVRGRRDRLLFGGGSAGARGGMVHLDYVPEMLGEAAAKNVDVVGFLDSPAWVDVAPYTSSFLGFPYITQHVHGFANVAHLGEECAAKYSGVEAWKCMFGQYRLPTLKTRYFLVAAQFDAYQLGNNIGHNPSNDNEKRYSEEVAARMRSLVDTVAAMPQRNFAYSWACYNHMVSVSDAGFNTHTCEPAGTTMSEALKQFLGWDSVTTSEFKDTCSTFECGAGCSLAFEEEYNTSVEVTLI